MTLFY